MHAHGHRQRLRERMLKDASAIADYEVLELMLGNILIRKDTKPIAKELLARFGSFRAVLDARAEELQEVPGFGPALAAHWKLLREVMARYAESPARQRIRVCSPSYAAYMARTRLAGLGHEEFWVAYLNTQHYLLSWERASQGSVNSAPLYPREVIARALALKASSLILVHNHPSGSSEPSGPDISLTRELRELGRGMGVFLQDHIIVTEDACYSLSCEGLIEPSGHPPA